MPNGTLKLLPFHAAGYRQDVHSATYRCVASNSVGAITSREVHVRAVVTQAYVVEAVAEEAPQGCTAVIRCTAPSFVRDLVRVVSWMQEPNNFFYPSLQGDGKHHVLPTGELLVHNVEYSDQFPRYWCRTMHRLTRQVVMSSPANLRVGEVGSTVPPTMLVQTGNVHVAQDEGAVLLCLALACPEPSYSWQMQSGHSPRARQLGAILAIETATPDDAGTYRCTAHNAAGEASAELRLSVATPLEVEVEPSLLTVQLGGAAEFRCRMSAPGGLITWYKDGAPVPGGRGGGPLFLGSVSREDRGMYQCVVRRAEGDTAQASAELRLGDAPPELQYSFIEQTLQPGPSVSLKCSAAGQPTPTISWTLDGFPLPINQRFVIGQYETVHGDIISHVNISHVMVEDGGEYSCTAQNRAGQAKHSARLNVYGLPSIRAMPKVTAVAGETLLIKCPVAGFPIEEIKWERAGVELPEDIRQKVLLNGVLMVERVQKSLDAGVYSCSARNKQGHTARRNGEVQVIVPPSWEVEPQDTSVDRGRHAWMHCQARGVPPPTTVWKKAVGGRTGEYQEIRERQSVRVLANGTLVLHNAGEDAEGYYMCQANNSIGSALGKMVQLRVNSTPFFSSPSRLVTVKKGKTAVLQCDVNGDKPIAVIWLRGKMELTPATNYRVTVKQDPTLDGVTAELHLASSEASDSGSYYCQARNIFGSDKQLVQLQVQEPPPSPTSLQTALVSSRSLNLQWQYPVPADSPEVTRFIVEYRQSSAPGPAPWQHVEVVGQHAAIIQDLRPATRYTVRVLAEGPAGQSSPSQVLAVRTEPQQPAGPPLGVSARATSSTSALVTWSAPLPDLRHGDITSYNVGFRELNGAAYNFTSVASDVEDSGELKLTGLARFTRYSIVVQAVNSVGSGPLSEPVSVVTQEDVPSAPPDEVRCAALSSQSLQLTWQPPPSAHVNGVLQGYRLHYEPTTPDPRHLDVTDSTTASSLRAVLLDLRKATNYSVTVRAFTRKGDGVPAKPVYCTTAEDAPGPPADAKVVVSSTQSLLVSWLPPTEPNGIVTKFYVYKRAVNGREELDHGKQMVSASQTSYEMKGLQQNVNYQFWVTASTRAGEGQSSHVVSETLTEKVPARIASIGTVVYRAWRASVALPCRAVGQPQPRLAWTRSPSLSSSLHHDITSQIPQQRGQVLDSGELMISAIAKEDAGNYTCAAENMHGADSVTYTLVVQVPPSAPQLFVGSATSSSILLHWKAGDNGGAVLTGYTLHYRRTHGDPSSLDLPRRAHSYELKGLQCGSTYHLQLVAHNLVGSSPGSAALSVRTQGQAPGTPSSAALLRPNSTGVLLRLASWPDNGCPLLYFVVRYRPLHAASWTLVSNSLQPQRRFVSGLAPASGYQLQIEAHNIAGSSTAEFSFFTLTKDGAPPPPEVVERGGLAQPFYTDLRVVLPLAGAAVAVVAACATAAFCWRSKQSRPAKESLENQQNAEAQRERYYATIHKMALQAADKIPETSEDISPYATFQLSEPAVSHAGSHAAPHPTHQNTLLHSFMYHEQAMTEGCASPPPPPPALGPKGRGRRRSGHKTHADSDESDSDADQLTSSRTESSNQLDTGPPRICGAGPKHNFIYHGAQSSTSSDISPMSEQKTLPRRGRHSRWLGPSKPHSLGGHLRHDDLGPSTSTARRRAAELSEAECDIDTLKKLKLGLRSSLWSRPSSSSTQPPQPGHPSDYSIAV